MKKGQFFIIGVILLAVSISVLVYNFMTVEKASIYLFEAGTDHDFRNIVTSITEKNDQIEGDGWWNTSWKIRKLVSISAVAGNPTEINLSISSADIASCEKEIRVINSTGEIDSDVTADTGCNVTFTIATGNYYMYYNNSAASKPAYRNTVSGNEGATYSVAGREYIGELCTHLETIYLQKGIYLNCTESETGDWSRLNYTIDFKSKEFEFYGYIN